MPVKTQLPSLPRPFWILLTGQSLSRFGTATGGVGLVLLMLTGSNPVLGIGTIQMALMTPWILLAPLAGVIADRWPKRTTIITCDLGRAASAFGMLTWDQNHAALVTVVIVSTCLDVVFAPALRALLPELAHPEQVTTAVSTYEFSSRAAEILGTMAAGLITTRWGFTGICSTNIVSYLTSCAFMLAMPATTPTASPHNKSETLGTARNTAAGIRYIRHHPRTHFVVMFFAVASIFFAAIPIVLPVAVTTNYHLNDTQYSALLSVQSIGGVIGAALAGRLGRSSRILQLLASGVTAWGLIVTILLASPTSAPLSAYLGYLALGIVANAVNVVYELFIQHTTDPTYLGRVFSLDMALSSATSLGAILTISMLAHPGHATRTATLLAIATMTTGICGWAISHRPTLQSAS